MFSSAVHAIFLAGLMDGLKQDRDDAIHLTFTPVSEHMFLEEQEESESGDSEETAKSIEKMAVDSPIMKEHARIAYTPPPLPLSPISNPASPARKRARHASWEPPSHIPEFLPPFPVPKDNSAPNSPEQPPPFELPPQQHPILGKNDKPLSPLPQVSTSTSSSDYLTPVPYSQSSLATIPPWHLPSPPTETTLQPTLPRLQTPQTQPALLGAYHHILTHPQSRNTNSANPSRHRVALSILYQTETNPRWEPADTLFSTSVPNAPRVSAMPPSHPVSKKAEEEGEKVDQEGNRLMLPSVPPIPVSNIDHITPLMSQQGSRIPEAARHVLSVSLCVQQWKLF
jgi:Wiskott-Aldrich syndrome protein